MPFDIWTNFTDDIIGYAMSSYSSLEPWVYPLFFIGIIGYIYTAMNSLVSAIAAILVTLGIYAGTTNVFAEVPAVNQFFYIITIIGLSLLVVTIAFRYTKGRGY